MKVMLTTLILIMLIYLIQIDFQETTDLIHHPELIMDYLFLKKRINKDENITLIEIGQSYQLDKNKYIESNSGINDKFSDIVINFRLVPHERIKINSYLKIDKDESTIKTAYSDFLIHQKIQFYQ